MKFIDLRECQKVKDFVEYFDYLEDHGIGYGMSDLYRKAEQLDIKPPEGF